jgi:oxygen-independent coproporphyrinogen-3 oxidase
MAVKKRLGSIRGVEEEVELRMMRHTRDRLTEYGMPPYEISNYAAAGQECRHNLVYWTGGNYVGLGPSAASHIEGWRWRNRPHLGEWERSTGSDRLPAIEVERLAPPRRAGELAMLMLRLTGGLDLKLFTDRTGHDAARIFADAIDRLAGPGLIEVDSGSIRLTDAGLSVADTISSEFLDPEFPT